MSDNNYEQDIMQKGEKEMSKKPLFKNSERLFLVVICIGLVLIGADNIIEGINIDNMIFEVAGGLGAAAIAVGAIGLIVSKRK